jgi:hypothetical protein
VNGASTKRVRQHAVIRDSMAMIAGLESKGRATSTAPRKSRVMRAVASQIRVARSCRLLARERQSRQIETKVMTFVLPNPLPASASGAGRRTESACARVMLLRR